MQDLISKRDKEFEEKFDCVERSCDGYGNIQRLDENGEICVEQCEFHAKYLFPITSFRHEDMKAVLEWVVELVKRKYSHELGDYINATEGAYTPTDVEVAEETMWNKAIDSVIFPLTEAIKQIK
jgi:hypothetical protein